MPAQPPRWGDARLEADRARAIGEFRTERLREPLGLYRELFERYRKGVERLFAATDDLAGIRTEAARVLADGDLRYAARYLASPPISEDDLEVLSDASLGARALRRDPGAARRAVETILLLLDRERFPWLSDHRDPTDEERRTAVVATSAMIASQRVLTERMNAAPRRQEALVRERLADAGFVEDEPRPVPTVFAAPPVGHFTGECVVGGSRKADIVVRLGDGRIMPIECKVSNSEINSIKRLRNDAAVKARVWIDDLGRNNVVPAAVLDGVFKLSDLRDAQERGLAIFWSHSLGELLAFATAET